jgi:L-glyceraldehyde 3-phosphate reductase
MWPGPYGEWGSKKYLVASLDQSLKRLGVDYVDIFYSHRPDPNTPLEETLGALDLIVRQGKALYAGISSYNGEMTCQAHEILSRLGTPLTIHQPSYSMLNRWIEKDLLAHTHRLGVGVIAFCPLAQGLLTSKYLHGIPEDSRAASPHGFLKREAIKPELQAKLRRLNELAQARGQTLAQMALAWVLRDERVTSALIGASRASQIEENVAALNAAPFTDEELSAIDAILEG